MIIRRADGKAEDVIDSGRSREEYLLIMKKTAACRKSVPAGSCLFVRDQLKLIEVIPDRALVVLLDNLDDDGAVWLGGFFNDFMLYAVSFKLGFVAGVFFLDELHRIIVPQVFF